ncbi:MAG: nucleotide sugar dehydrogenase [Theionarchaea archaeon]|nr:nucleotide sugar dehydrogenase [Theionarchaea archaeon]
MNVCIIGLGYVGLPLGIALASHHTVYGFDVSEEKVSLLTRGHSYIEDIPDSVLTTVLNKTFFPTHDSTCIEKVEFIIICVPTPIDERKCPDLNFVRSACEIIYPHLKKGQTVILESTTYPGTTEEVVIPILEKSHLKAGEDFGVAYSPERIDPGNPLYTIENTPKVVGALTEKDLDKTLALYSSIITHVVPVKNLKTAEASKILENVFRAVNIALINEISLLFEPMGIDVWEVIEAARTKKPNTFMPHYPSIGVGGHCIPVDPYYLAWKSKQMGYAARFIELSGEINDYMPLHTFYMVLNALKGKRKIEEAKVAVFGVAYKKDISDVRESPALKLIELLTEYKVEVVFHDPHVKEIRTKYGVMKGLSLQEAAQDCDCIVITVDHSTFKMMDLDALNQLMRTPIIVDGKNVLDNPGGFFYYGIGKVSV